MFKIWNKIVRKIANVLLHKETFKKQEILNILNQNNNSVRKNNNSYLIENSDFKFQLRKQGSDINVYEQVFIRKEYQPLIDFLIVNNRNPQLIIDCGANIGLTSIQLAKKFLNASIVSVEPDENNFKQLIINTKIYPNIFPKQNAIWSTNEILKIDRNFRDGKDWSRRTVKSSSNAYQEVQAITILNILEYTKQDKIDLLKIDIEGAESELFKNDNTCIFLDKTECIAIELHDECVNRLKIYDILKKKGFILFNSGELTIGIRG